MSLRCNIPAVVLTVVLVAFVGHNVMSMPANNPTTPGMSMGQNDMSFNLSSLPGILGFLQMEGIDPTKLILPNCIRNGEGCQMNSGPQCCFNPVFTCQPNRSGPGNACYVVPVHAPHVPQVKQILKTLGVTTELPVE